MWKVYLMEFILSSLIGIAWGLLIFKDHESKRDK
jgi:hypothetical protein